MNHDVSAQFNRFAGKEVSVTEQKRKHTFRNGDTYESVQANLDENDPVVQDLKAEVSKSGLQLRLWLPNTMGTCDMQMNRVNVHIEKEDDGKYRIQPKITLG